MRYFYLLTVLIVACIGILFCSNEENKTAEKQPGQIEKMTNKAADDITKKLKDPMDKARATKELGEEQAKKIEETLK